MSYNISKLDHEIRQAGIPIEGVSSDGRIDFLPSATQAQKDQAATILSAHNPVWYIDQRLNNAGNTDGYASIGDQLDMLYKDKVNGTTTWQDHITAVKTLYPKN